MSLPADFPRPTKHVFSPGFDGECLVCGMSADFGGLHVTEAPVFPDPDEQSTPVGEWQAGDLLLAGSSVFEVVRSRFDSSRLWFIPLGPVGHGQGTAPRGAVLLVRDGVKA